MQILYSYTIKQSRDYIPNREILTGIQTILSAHSRLYIEYSLRHIKQSIYTDSGGSKSSVQKTQ